MNYNNTSEFENRIISIKCILEKSSIYPSKEYLKAGKNFKLHESDDPQTIIHKIIDPGKLVDFLKHQTISNKCLIFGEIQKGDNDLLNKISMQAVITENYTLCDCLENIPKDLKWFYYRLDYDLTCGILFKENIPHIHSKIKGAPRFPFDFADEDPIISFIEFIYQNHFFEDWFESMKNIFFQEIDFSGRFKDTICNQKKLPTPTAKDLLVSYKDDILKIKKYLINRKGKIFKYKYRINKDFEFLNYKKSCC